MIINEVIEKEETNSHSIYLIRQGILWTAFERSAYRMMKSLPSFYPTKINIPEGINESNEVCSIRFADKRLESVLNLLRQVNSETPLEISQGEEMVTILVPHINEKEEAVGFSAWRKTVVMQPAKKKQVRKKAVIEESAEDDHEFNSGLAFGTELKEYIIQKLVNYPVANKTPLQTAQFVAEIQEFLKN